MRLNGYKNKEESEIKNIKLIVRVPATLISKEPSWYQLINRV